MHENSLWTTIFLDIVQAALKGLHNDHRPPELSPRHLFSHVGVHPICSSRSFIGIDPLIIHGSPSLHADRLSNSFFEILNRRAIHLCYTESSRFIGKAL
jgi:hypothetical protein